MRSLAEMTAKAAELQAALSEWDGSVWTLESFGMTHPTFTLWVYARGRPGSLRILCSMPTYICGPIGWAGCRFTVSAIQHQPLDLYAVREQAASFEVRCHNVQLQDAPPPHWMSP